MKKMLFSGISILVIISLVPLFDWIYHRDRKPFTAPLCYSGSVPVRNDDYGEGHFMAMRKGGRTHKGLDIYAPLKSEVIAAMGGSVAVGYSKNGLGKYAIIRHSGEYMTLYGHLSEVCVKDRGRVRQGDVIGYVGKTGNARYSGIKPHLHFEVKKGGEYIDPILLLQ